MRLTNYSYYEDSWDSEDCDSYVGDPTIYDYEDEEEDDDEYEEDYEEEYLE